MEGNTKEVPVIIISQTAASKRLDQLSRYEPETQPGLSFYYSSSGNV
jgi:hypothetical protein